MMVEGDPKKPARPYWFCVAREMPALAIKSAEQEGCRRAGGVGYDVCERADGVSLIFAALGDDAQALYALGTSTKDCPGAERHKAEADR
jgi:hypothetical protein